MSNTLKAALAALCLAVIGVLTIIMQDYLGDSGGGEIPVPNVEPTVQAWQGENVYVSGPIVNVPAGVRITSWKIDTATTLNESWSGAGVGDFEDPLIPSDPELADISRVEVPRGSVDPIKLRDDFIIGVSDKVMPEKPPFPMYSEVTSQAIFDVWRRAKGTTIWKEQCEATLRALALVRSFWIEPTKQSISLKPTNIDQDPSGDGRCTYRHVVIDTAIAPPLFWAGSTTLPSAYLQAVTAAAPQGSMFYGPDEAGFSGMSISSAVGVLTTITANSNLPIMMTNIPRPEFEPFNVVYNPVINWFRDGVHMPADWTAPQFWNYLSCMSQGCGTGPRTPFPVLVLEGDPVTDWEAGPLLAYHNGAKAFLYYAMTVRLASSLEPGGMYFAGGNGDGTLLYYDPVTGDVLPSLRMVHLHIALQKIAKEMLQ